MREHTFVDQHGDVHPLIPGYRSRIKPGWEAMVAGSSQPEPSNDELACNAEETVSRVHLGVRMLDIAGCTLRGRTVLVVGCGTGLEAMLLAAEGAAHVVGTNYVPVGADGSRALNPADALLDERDSQRRAMLALLEQKGLRSSFEAADVSFITDDMAASSLSDESFDVIASWRTLEHLARPAACFDEMYRVLRPGGFAYHEYNPFFAIDGGHSLVTLDVPWGHVRLAAGDVDRYLQMFRPAERGEAMAYYHHRLNRMTIAQMQTYAHAAGLETVALIPRARTEDVLAVSRDLLAQAKRIYPDVTLNDLVSRMVRVVLRRPCEHAP